MKRLKTGMLLIFALTGTSTGKAQMPPQKNDSIAFDFVPGAKVIFEDNFTQDSVGKFPSKWRLYPTIPTLEVTDSITNTRYYPITKQKNDTESFLAIASDNHYFPIKPKVNRRNYLKDTFTIEFDFRMDSEQCDPAIVFFDDKGDNIFESRILGTGEIISTLLRETRYSVDYPGRFDWTAWHHFAISYKHRDIKYFINQYLILHIPDCKVPPCNFIIAGNSYTEGNPVVAFKKFRLATGIPNVFNKILTENKFTTHAIHFQTAQSAIEPESIDFIKQLADWLKANPNVKLEIDGYTDNEGDAGANIILSNERANAVKTALEALGIDAARLTAKGFGEGSPIDTNDTPEGKAQNRRVEFIKRSEP